MSIVKTIHPSESTHIPEPPIARFLFADTRMAWFWLIVRLYVGYQWLTAGLEKLTGHDFTIGSSFGQATHSGPWVFGAHGGVALTGFIKGAIAQASGAYAPVQGWYAWFLQHAILPNTAALAYVVTFGEVLVGLGLIFSNRLAMVTTLGSGFRLAHSKPGQGLRRSQMPDLPSPFAVGDERYLAGKRKTAKLFTQSLDNSCCFSISFC